MPLSASLLREVLQCDPDKGTFVWKWRQDAPLHWNTRYAGTKAGYRRKDQWKHVTITVGNRHFLAHRIMWLYVYGEWPEGIIDHINSDTGDNRIHNLRMASHSENQCNRPNAQKNGLHGFKGVSFDGRKTTRPWRARINVNRRAIELGWFDTPEEAVAAYRKAASLHHGVFARLP